MIESDRVTIEYHGDPRFIRAFVQALHDEGLDSEYELPNQVFEKRGGDLPSTIEQVGHVYAAIEAWAAGHPIANDAGVALTTLATAKVNAAVQRWRAGRLAQAADVKVTEPRHRRD